MSDENHGRIFCEPIIRQLGTQIVLKVHPKHVGNKYSGRNPAHTSTQSYHVGEKKLCSHYFGIYKLGQNGINLGFRGKRVWSLYIKLHANYFIGAKFVMLLLLLLGTFKFVSIQPT